MTWGTISKSGRYLMKIIKWLLIIVVSLVALAAVVGFFLPSSAHVERSIVINAPACNVHGLVNSYRGFNRWSPWANIDPDGTTYEFAGPDWGVGAKQSWASEDNNVGSGSQVIVSSTPCSEVLSKLDFGSQGQADAFFKLQPVDAGTQVTWGFDTEFGMNLIGRYFGMMFDSMIGGNYESGLASLKALAEKLPQADIDGLSVELVETEAATIAYLTKSTGTNNDEIGAAIGSAYGVVMQEMASAGLNQAGAPITINSEIREDGYTFDAGIPVDAEPVEELKNGVMVGQTYAGKALRFTHTGPYHNLPATYEKIAAFLEIYNYKVVDRSWDAYVSDPGDTAEEDLLTHIFFPVE